MPEPNHREPAALQTELTGWIRERVENARLRGAIFGLSGGIDSAVVCGLAADALGPERCLGLVMPIESIDEDAELAQRVADRFRVQALRLELGGPFQHLLETLTDHRERAERVARGKAAAAELTAPIVTEDAEILARANLKPRLRMISLYYFANLLGYIVLGTGNKDEFTVGYFTKWGDGAADAFPLGDLVKGEVRALARHLDVPAAVIERPPSAGLWQGQTDEAELGISYEQLDAYLLEGTSGDADADAEIERRAALSQHKLESPPVARPG